MVKNYKSLKKAFTLIYVLLSLTSFSQQSLGRDSSEDLLLFQYYQTEDYSSIIQHLESKQDFNPNQELFLILSQLKTGNENIEPLERWIKQNETHSYQTLARFHYSEKAFYSGDSLASGKYFNSIDRNELGQSSKGTYGFIGGVLALQQKKYKRAKSFFDYSEKNEFANTDELTYYQAFASYHLNDLEGALSGFTESVKDPKFSTSSSYFLAKIMLERGQNEEVIKLAQNELSDEVSITNSGFYQLIGEAYAADNNASKADVFFEKAIEKHPTRPSAALFYRAGISKFKLGEIDESIELLKKAGLGAGEYAELSAFQLGRLYIEKNELSEALASYILASASKNEERQEEALYQSSKLNAALERYSEAINYCKDYLRDFANGQWAGEVRNLLVQCYLKTSDYDLAISELEEAGISNRTQQDVYQKITFQKGLQAFNDGDFRASKVWFQKSQSYPIDRQLLNETHFFLGEIHLRYEEYVQAIMSYQKQNPRTPESSYGIGYALFNQQKYQEAIPYFTASAAVASNEMRQDAALRLADCYFATKAYEPALSTYNRLPQSVYVTFQQAMVFRYLDRNEDASMVFEKIPANSVYGDDALFFLAQIAFESERFTDSESKLNSFIVRFPDSKFIARSYLNRALSRINLAKYDEAKADLEFILENYLQREESFSAILGLQDLQRKGIKIGNLDTYISEYKAANPEDGSLQVVEFEAAKAVYFDQEYSLVIPKLDRFLADYPDSKFRPEALYYLADSYYRTSQWTEAKKIFTKQMFVRNVYTSRVINRLGEIHVLLEDFESALEAYSMLKDLNLSDKDNYNANSGLMNANFSLGQHAQAITYANQVSNSSWKPLNADKEAKMIIAKSNLNLGRLSTGQSNLDSLALGTDLFAAEGAYLSAEIDYGKGNHDASLDKLFDLNGRFGSYTFWIEKSFLLIAENYIAKGELFQAKATLQSILQHSSNEETLQIANERLLQIEQENLSDTTKQDNK